MFFNIFNKKVKEISISYDEGVKTIKTPNILYHKGVKNIKTDIEMHSGNKMVISSLIYYLYKKYKKELNIYISENKFKYIKKMRIKKINSFINILPIMIHLNIEGKVEEILYNDKELQKYIKKIKSKKNRFSFINLGLYGVEQEKIGIRTWCHMNLLIYDKDNNTIYRFEPQGESCIYNMKSVNNNLDLLFSMYYINYKSLDKCCPKLKLFMDKKYRVYKEVNCKRINVTNKKSGPQAIEGLTKKNKSIDASGYCAYWSILFIDFILTNCKSENYKEEKLEEYLQDMIFGIHKEHESFLKYIRNYYVFGNTLSHNILKGRSKRVINKFIKEEISKMN